MRSTWILAIAVLLAPSLASIPAQELGVLRKKLGHGVHVRGVEAVDVSLRDRTCHELTGPLYSLKRDLEISGILRSSVCTVLTRVYAALHFPGSLRNLIFHSQYARHIYP